MKKVDPLEEMMKKSEEKKAPDVMTGTSNQALPEIPYDTVPLPSKGKLYDEDHPLYMEETVPFRGMGNREENILHSKGLIKKGLVVDELIKSCLINKAVEPQDLLSGDKSAILVAIRISGLTSEYRTKTMCPDCDGVFPHVFNLSQCEIKSLGAEPDEPNKNIFSFTLPKSGATVKFKLLTAGDERDISETQEQRRKALIKQAPGATEIDTNISDRLIKSIISVNGEKDKNKIQQFVMNSAQMSAQDSRALREYIDDIEPELLMQQEVKCPHCGVQDEHVIPMGIDFLWPERRKVIRRRR